MIGAVRAESPPAGTPTAWLPPVGSAWMRVDGTTDGRQPVGGFGLRPVRPLVAGVRQGRTGMLADLTFELLPLDEDWPALVLDARGIGGAPDEQTDSLLLGLDLSGLEVSAGVGWHGTGAKRPVLHLRRELPIEGRLWIAGGLGGPDGPAVTAGWYPLPGLSLHGGWQRDRGAVSGFSLMLAADRFNRPWPFGTGRPATGSSPAAASPWRSSAAHLATAMPDNAQAPVTLATHRLGLPGTMVTIPARDIAPWHVHRRSGAEIRRHARFQRAGTPSHLDRHWELVVDTSLDLEPPGTDRQWPRRLSAGLLAHILPWPGWIATASGRAGWSSGLPATETTSAMAGNGDAGCYLRRHLMLERLQLAHATALTPAFDLLLEAGYLDAMHGGGGGELRLQPPTARWSAGLAAHQVWKRTPSDGLTLARGSRRHSLHATLGWDSADAATRTQWLAGRYLAGDWGGGLILSHQAGTGAVLALEATATTRASHLGLTLTLPLGGPADGIDLLAQMRVRRLAPTGGARPDRVLTLADLRHTAGYGRLITDWDRQFRP
ncbi:YjbH domain-containing protein [Niveispirillum fermenti]|uniref:YjbH domain-containing protein n=1 Tax=Niveispirillum fermenti TaxID=1233113 RepID=UPI003A85E74E